MGDWWSIAWRVHDAQFWGVPQRRKRIALIADFGGQSAPEILFERKGLYGHIEPSGEEREEVTRRIERSTYGTGCYCLNDQGGAVMSVSEEVTGILRAETHGHLPTISFQERAGKPGGGKGILMQGEKVGALSTVNNQRFFDSRSMVIEPRTQDGVPRIHDDVSPTLNTMKGGQRQPCVMNLDK